MACTGTRNTAATAGRMITLEIDNSVTIYPGALVAVAAGKAVPAAKVEEQLTMGMAYSLYDGRVVVERGAHLWDNDTTNPVTAAHIGGSCYIVDDCTVTALATGSSIAGKVLGIEDGQVIVETL